MKKYYRSTFFGLVSALALSGCQSNDAYLYQLNNPQNIKNKSIVTEQFLKENGKIVDKDNFVYQGILQDGRKLRYLGLKNKVNPQKYDTYPALILDGLYVIIEPISDNKFDYYITKTKVLSFKEVRNGDRNGEFVYQIPDYKRTDEHRIAGKFIQVDDSRFIVIH